ncbi:MAG: site-specific integrase [Marichromatium sp.]|nr:site-specific integrase [Marichromatium sp.]
MPIRKTTSGTFMVDVTIGDVRIRKTRASRRDALALERALLRYPVWAIKEHGTVAASRETTLGDALSAVYEAEWRHASRPETYRAAIRVLEGFFGPALPMRELNTDRCIAWVNHERKRGMAPATINRRWSILHKAASWAHERGFMDTVPSIPKLRVPESMREYLHPEEVRQIIAGFKELDRPEMSRYVVVLYSTGARPGEALALTTDDVDLDRSQAILSGAKTGEERVVPLRDEAVHAIRCQIAAQGDGRIFRFTYEEFTYFWNIVRHVNGKGSDPRWVPYALRHTFGSLLVQNGCDIVTIKKLMGHKRLEQTLAYAKLHDQALTAGIGNLPAL